MSFSTIFPSKFNDILTGALSFDVFVLRNPLYKILLFKSFEDISHKSH